LLNRSDPLSLPPLAIVTINREFAVSRAIHGRTCIGSSSYDRSLVCIDDTNETITCYRGENLDVERKAWPSLDTWLTEELERLALLFSPEGKRLVAEEFVLPGLEKSKAH